ncbi:DUF2334 domain-containing protein [Clostridium sp.]|uniref:DUF2334 domain-containing protein n=1 Tax=Clostridium sp. TaxID=1506 RepID=UPI002611CCFF|nr:DUF2334 domain-containing protein [Clostridium sp.]
MIRKRFFYTLIIFLIFLFISCSAKTSIQNDALLKSNTNLKADYTNFKGLDMPQDNAKFKINGKTLDLRLPVYLTKNRYYICLNEFIEQLGGEINKTDNLLSIQINNNSYEIDITNKFIRHSDNTFPLKKALQNKNDIYYIGFSDFSQMLNLYTRWDKNNKLIDCKINGFNNANAIPYKSKIKQIGFIRFEDVGLNSQPYSKEYFEKLRIIANYMYQIKIPYHIAWIPRYIIPNKGVDNDPLTKNNFEMAEMVYSLDYFTMHNGIIGLHGYTHQRNNDESGAGFEFGKFQPSEKIFKERIEKAIKTASYLDISVNFFEAPHYEITPYQNKIAEKYFKILYYPFKKEDGGNADLTKPQLSPYNKSSYYISTPLDYIPLGKEDIALDRIKNSDTSQMGSVFFHPALENSYITLTENDNIPTYTYTDNSILKRLITILEEKGFNIIKVTDI